MKESLYREADFRATEGEAAAKRAKAEVADLTKVLEGKSKELEDVIAEHQVQLAAALKERDVARTATTTVKKQLAALEKKHAEEVATREASESTLLAVQKEKTSFEAFVREMSRQLLGKSPNFYCFELFLGVAGPSASPPRGPVAESGESSWGPVPERGGSAWGGPVPERGESA